MKHEQALVEDIVTIRQYYILTAIHKVLSQVLAIDPRDSIQANTIRDLVRGVYLYPNDFLILTLSGTMS